MLIDLDKVRRERMEKAIQLQGSHDLQLPQSDVLLLKNQICPTLNADEFKVFCYAVKRTGLDPFMRQIHAVKRKNNKTGKEDMAIQVGIDGYRLIADRTGLYAGSDDPVFDNENEPNKARVTVYKMVQGQRCAFSASARWNEYYPGDGGPGFMWRKMPCGMLGKVAETLALRKAFPAELSGVYTDEEMAQADKNSVQVQATPVAVPEAQSAVKPGPGPSEAQLRRLFAISKASNVSVDQVKDYMITQFNKSSTKELTVAEYNQVCDAIQNGQITIKEIPEIPEPGSDIGLNISEEQPTGHALPWEKYMESK